MTIRLQTCWWSKVASVIFTCAGNYVDLFLSQAYSISDGAWFDAEKAHQKNKGYDLFVPLFLLRIQDNSE